jgi:hypothetical protein
VAVAKYVSVHLSTLSSVTPRGLSRFLYVNLRVRLQLSVVIVVVLIVEFIAGLCSRLFFNGPLAKYYWA